MKRLTLMLIAGAVLPVAAIAQTTTPQAPPTATTGNPPVNDPAMTSVDATATPTAPTSNATPGTTVAEPTPVELKSHKKKKKPSDATEPRL